MKKDCMRILDMRENPGLGGINSGLGRLLDEFRTRQEVEIVYSVLADSDKGWLFDKAKSLGIKIEIIHCNGPGDMAVPFRIKKFIREKKIDLVHTRGYRANFYVRTMMDLRLSSLPSVITKHGMPVIHSFRIRIYSLLDQRPTRLANRIIAVDRMTLDGLMRWGVSKEKARLIPNAAPRLTLPPNEEVVRFKAQLGIPSAAKVVLYLGRLEREKGVYELLDAHIQLSAQGKAVYTLFVGDGSARPHLENIAKSHESGHSVRFLGQQTEVNYFLASCDLVCLPSYSEGLSNAILEAMAAGKPVVATAVGGTPDLVTHEDNGLLVPVNNVHALSNAILYLLDNPIIARAMGVNGLKRAMHSYSSKKVVDAIICTYQEACQEYYQ